MKRFNQVVVLVVISIFATIFISEFLLNILNISRFYNTHNHPPQFAFYLTDKQRAYYVNIPSSNIEFIYGSNPRGYFGERNEVSHVTNSWGFRGGEFSYAKPDKTVRMVFLGDSFTFGEGVKFEDTYPEVVASLMKQINKAEGINYESYNFGVGGYNVSQELFLLENLALYVHPDIIVLGYVLNDAEPELFYADSTTNTVNRRPREVNINEGLPDMSPPSSALYKLRIARLIWQVFHKERLSRQTESYYKSLYKPDNPDWKATKDNLQKFISICKENKIHCYVICFPIIYKLNKDYPFKYIHTLIKDEINAQTHKYIHFIDLLNYLKTERDSNLWVYPTDQHPNEIAHRIVGRALFNAIVKDRRFLDKESR